MSRKGKGKLQSPFAGRYEVLDTAQPLLYARCTRLEDLPQAAAPQAATEKLADTPGVVSARKRRRLDKATSAPEAPSTAPESKPAAQRPEDYNNKDQALSIRSSLGGAYTPAVEPGTAPPAEAAKPNGFAFGFSVQQQQQAKTPDAPSDRIAETAERPAQDATSQPAATKLSKKQKKQKQKAAKEALSNGHAEPQPAAAATAVPAAPPAAAEPVPAAAAEAVPAAAPNEAPLVPRRVFVGGMPFAMEEDDVRAFWEECGAVEEADLMRFPDTGRFKGIAFITFATEDGYQAALACDGEVHNDVRIKVEPCKSAGLKKPQKAFPQAAAATPAAEPAAKPAGPAPKAAAATAAEPVAKPAGPAPKTSGYDVAYVGNIHFMVTAKQLELALEGCSVKKVRLHTDADTHRSKGFAHVHFADEASLDRAVKMDGLELSGRKLRIGYAQPKKKADA